MKAIILILFLVIPLSAQTIPLDSLYLGQVPPDDSAVIFAPNIVSLPNQFENAITFSPDGKECYFEMSDDVFWKWGSIMYARYENNKWSDFKEVPFIESRKYFDILPFYSPDGQKFLFSSARPSQSYSQVDLWMCRKLGNNWSAPLKLSNSINDSMVDESYSSISNIGNIYFNKDETKAIWFSAHENGGYLKAKKVPYPVNSEFGAWAPYIAPDESYIIFSSNRPDSYGEIDLYISYRKKDGSWTDPKNLGPKINGNDKEAAPRASPDGKYLFFSRSKVRQYCHIYWVRADFIEELRDK
jgi:hypothetical protein